MIHLLHNLSFHERHYGDGGPKYWEYTDGYIVEPWNAFSSLFFLVPVLYWIYKLRGQYRKHIIITLILPLLMMNGIGSTLYHAFRTDPAYLVLDAAPARIMMLTLGVYFWSRISGSYWKGLLVIPPIIAIQIALRTMDLSPLTVFINIAYAIEGILLMFLPLTIILFRSNFFKWHLIALTACFLVLALTFRSLDYPHENPFPTLMPQGTHFLWHIISAFAVFSLGWYLYYLREADIRGKKKLHKDKNQPVETVLSEKIDSNNM